VVTIDTDGLSPEEIALKIANEQQIAADAEHRGGFSFPRKGQGR
jgi:hypothetical protein